MSRAGRAATSRPEGASSSRIGPPSFLWRRYPAPAFAPCCGGRCDPGGGAQKYVLQEYRDGAWRSVGGVATTARERLPQPVRSSGEGRDVPALVPVGRRRQPVTRGVDLAPVRAGGARGSAQALLALGARAALRDPAGGLRAVGPVEHEPLRVRARHAGLRSELREDPLDGRVQVGATSWTSPIGAPSRRRSARP